jgi:hypothetical protein
MGVIYETSLYAFLLVTVVAGGGAAFMIGRAAAKTWKPFWQAVIYVMILSAAIRFLHWGLFAGATLQSWREAQGSLLSLHYYLSDALILLIFAALGFRLRRTSQMLRQYSWLTRKTTPLSWKLR